jgi:signal transduction histidine kinase
VQGVAYLFRGPIALLTVLSPSWVTQERERARRLLQSEAGPTVTPNRWRVLAWALFQGTVGTGAGLLALLVVGNAAVAPVATAFWWAFDPADPPHLFVEIPIDGWAVALTLGPLQFLLCLTVAAFGLPPAARLLARTCLTLTAPSTAEQLADRVAVLTETRADVLDAHAGELRRIERDLHDGTQAHLVSIAVRLGVAEKAQARGDHARAADLMRQAHEEAETAMAGLRAVLRSVYPPILADRGLPGALATLTAGCAVTTRLELGEVGRLPAALESVVYFAVSEALTNVVRHSGASSAVVSMSRPGTLQVSITDDGKGGADPRKGTGINGIRERVKALDGDFAFSSPVGGPTTIRLDLPCAS